MKRAFLAVMTSVFFAALVGPVLADDVHLNTAKGVKKFWQEHQVEGGQ